MGTWENLNNQIQNKSSYISELRNKLWKEGKIKLEGYTYLEWKEWNKK